MVIDYFNIYSLTHIGNFTETHGRTDRSNVF